MCFGYLDSGRHVPISGVDDAIGALLDMLICWIPVGEKAGVGDLLESVQEDYRQSISHFSGALGALIMTRSCSPGR